MLYKILVIISLVLSLFNAWLVLSFIEKWRERIEVLSSFIEVCKKKFEELDNKDVQLAAEILSIYKIIKENQS